MEIFFLIFIVIYYFWSKEPKSYQQEMASYRKSQETKGIVVATVVLSTIFFGPYFLLDNWFDINPVIYILIVFSIPFLVYFIYVNWD